MHKSLFVVLSVTLIAVSLAGCPGDSARAQRWDSGSSTPTRAPNAQAFTPKPEHPHSPRREAHPEAFLSAYNNPDEGVSFRYPRNYVLEEGEVQEHSYFLKTQEQLDLEEPGAELIVTVLIPEDGYPNTTFEHGSLQLWVREAESAAACRTDADNSQQVTRGNIWTSDALRLDVAEVDSLVGGTSLRERSYSAFSGGKCYEFLTAVAVDQTADQEGSAKPADTGKILKRLENIVKTLRLSSKP